MGILSGHLSHGRQGPRSSDGENVPMEQITKSESVWINTEENVEALETRSELEE